MAQTPLSPLPAVGHSVRLTNSTTVFEAIIAPFSNTKEVIFLNTSLVNRVLLQIAVVVPALPLPATLITANSIILPAGASVSLSIGPEGNRQPMATQAFWLATPGSNLNFVLKLEQGTNTEVNITYVQCAGGGGQIGGI